MIDKARLLAGESTENMALQISERRAVESLEALAAALSQSLIARQADPGDSRPPIVIESNPKK